MKDKKTFVTIIVLLAMCLPAAIYGTYMHKSEKNIIIDDNPNKEYILNNKVYFYDNNTLSSTYKCSGVCSKTTPIIDDDGYNTQYYKLGEIEAPTKLNNDYALFNEDDKTVLYSISTATELLKFDGIKNYNVEHTEPVIIVKSNGQYGVISLTDMIPLIGYNYDYMAIPNRVNDGVLDTSKFIAKSGTYWYVLERDGTYNHEPFNKEIVDFNDYYIITENLNEFQIYDYEKNQYFKDKMLKEAHCIGDYVITIDQNNLLEVYNSLNNPNIYSLSLEEYTTIDFDLKGNKIDIYLNDVNAKSIVLNQ